jgi:hypothetical protein
MHPGERALVPLVALSLYLTLALARCLAAPDAYLPTERELAAPLADLGRVRAWRAGPGDAGLAGGGASAEPETWEATAHYAVTTPDGRTGLVSASVSVLRSDADARAFFEHFAAWLASPAAAPGAHRNRAWPTTVGPGPEAEDSLDFEQVYAEAGGPLLERRGRLMQHRHVVELVSAVGAVDLDAPGLSESERLLAFERTAAWVKERLLRGRADAAQRHPAGQDYASPEASKKVDAHYTVSRLRQAFDQYRQTVDELAAEVAGAG